MVIVYKTFSVKEKSKIYILLHIFLRYNNSKIVKNKFLSKSDNLNKIYLLIVICDWKKIDSN